MQDSIDAIYDYTEQIVKAQESSIVRLNNRSNIFIGFGATILRLAIDLPSSQEKTKLLVVILALITILTASVGLTVSMQGKVFAPSTLLKTQYLDADKAVHQYKIIEQYNKLIKEYEDLIKRKQRTINIMISLFCLTISSYAIGVVKQGDQFIDYLSILFNNFLPPS